jgi:hypothetical protein
VWLERGERRRAGHVTDPRAGLDRGGNFRNRIIRHANQDEPSARLDADAAVAQAGGNRRADAAGTDDRDAVEHLVAPVP